MTTLRRFATNLADIPMATAWYLADLGEAKGRQQLFTRQAPQRLKAESARPLLAVVRRARP